MRADTRLAGLTQRRPIVVAGRTLDSQLQHMLWVMARARSEPLHAGGVRRARAQYRFMPHVFEDALHEPPTREQTIPGAAGPLPIRIYDAGPRTQSPALVYFHGGGGVIGDLDTHDGTCRRLALAAGCRVIAVDYRLAPEHPFPAGHDDAVAAFRWLHAHATDFGIDPARIAVGGDSAGGNLAGAVCIACRGGASPCFGLLIYPGTDLSMQWESRELLRHGFFLETATIEWFQGAALGTADRSDPRVSILQAADLSGLPPLLVITAGFDPLRDEGEAFARAVLEAGSPVEHIEYPSLVHAFVQMTGVCRAAAAAIEDFGAALRRAFAGI